MIEAERPLPEKVRSLMPELVADLGRLVRIPSIAFPDFPPEPLHEAHDLIVELLRDAGVETIDTLNLPDTAPVIIGAIPAPDGAPTVLLYSHYDVVPAGDESLWSSPPFEPTERDGAIFGRGAADSKANVIAHVGALRAWSGRPPVGIKLVVEGQEEVGGGALGDYPQSNPDTFASDAMLIADMGNVRPGVPTLTVALRGMAQVQRPGDDARRRQAQRPVRRRGSGRADRDPPRALEPPRRERGRGRPRPSSRGVDGRRLQ